MFGCHPNIWKDPRISFLKMHVVIILNDAKTMCACMAIQRVRLNNCNYECELSCKSDLNPPKKLELKHVTCSVNIAGKVVISKKICCDQKFFLKHLLLWNMSSSLQSASGLRLPLSDPFPDTWWTSESNQSSREHDHNREFAAEIERRTAARCWSLAAAEVRPTEVDGGWLSWTSAHFVSGFVLRLFRIGPPQRLALSHSTWINRTELE